MSPEAESKRNEPPGDELKRLRKRIAELELAEAKLSESQRDLKESEERYRNLVNASPIPIFVHSNETIVIINREAIRALGGKVAEDFIGRSLWSVVAPDFKRIVKIKVDWIYGKLKNSDPTEMQFVRLDGDIIDVEVMGTMTDYKGRPSSQVVFKDITQRKLAEKAVEQRIRLEHIVSRISLKLMASDSVELERAIDDSLRIIGEYAEVDWSKLVLFSEDLEQIATIHEWCTPGVDSQKEFFLNNPPSFYPWFFQKLQEHEFVYIPNLDYLPPEAEKEKTILGNLSIQSLIAVPLISEEKLIGYLTLNSIKNIKSWADADIGLMQTISYIFVSSLERRKANESLKVQKTYMEELFNSSPDAIAVLDNNDGILRINREFINLFGFTEEEAVGKNINSLIAPGDLKEDAITLTQHISTPDTILDVERIRQSKSGGRIHVSIRGKPILLGSDQLAVYAIYRDITNRKKSEEDRIRLEEQLRQAQKMEAIGNLAGGIAHDFNNILAVIMGYTELTFEKLPNGSRMKTNLKHVLSAAEKAKEMVKQILAFSRKDERKREPVYLAKIMVEALQLLRSTLPTFIEIRSHIPKGLGPVLANSTQVHQVIMNICTNAAHAMMEKGGVLEIALSEVTLNGEAIDKKVLEPGKYQVMSFSDTGCGIEPTIAARIFEPYFTTKGQSEGTGMGLAVVHGIVKSHGGDIAVESEVGKGTRIRIFLPITEERVSEHKDSSLALQEGSGRILLVDDDPGLVEMGKLMLESMGYYVVIQNNSVDALETFRTGPDLFDLVITDQTMPKMTGDQLAVAIKDIRPDIPILLCTGFSERINEENFKSRGIDAFVMKPIVRKELARLVHDLLLDNDKR
ncbi:MAG: PAS domain S-box protein [Candidatus Omnitrophota bacterium]